jgi:capsular exopolysaccharide synthesis family protein
MAKSTLHCSFCGRNRDEVKILIAGQEGHICEGCVEHAKEIVFQEVDNKQTANSGYKLKIKKPVDLKKSLDEYVIGQDEAKRILAVAVYNHYKRIDQVVASKAKDDVEIEKSNIILVTSSMSGEGKSFIATNMAAVMAISGKKTLLVEFDIRKPKLMSGLGLNINEKTGLTHYLIGKSSVEEIIQPVKGVENLYIIPCGPVPPNPAELILTDRLKMMFDQLKQQFDVIIVDSAPVGMVSDGYVLANYVDATLFVEIGRAHV